MIYSFHFNKKTYKLQKPEILGAGQLFIHVICDRVAYHNDRIFLGRHKFQNLMILQLQCKSILGNLISSLSEKFSAIKIRLRVYNFCLLLFFRNRDSCHRFLQRSWQLDLLGPNFDHVDPVTDSQRINDLC